MPKTIHRPEYDVLLRLLKRARLDAGVLQQGLSDSLGRHQSFVSDVERGVRRIDIIELRDYCQAFGVDFPNFVAELEANIRLSNEKSKKTVVAKGKGTPRRTKANL